MTDAMPLRIGLIPERRYLSHLQPSGMAAALRSRGHIVKIIDPEENAFRLGDSRWLEGIDIIICRGRSVGVLSLLRWAEANGTSVINCSSSISSVLNKSEMAITLSAAGVLIPDSFLGPAGELAKYIPESGYPLILKPVFGDNCRGLRLVYSASELSSSEWQEPVALAQHFIDNEGYDLKLYGIGSEIWPVRKLSCLVKTGIYPGRADKTAEPHPVPLTDDMKALGLKCAALFGLELFGVDCIETPGGLMVIEVNDFPDYTAVPQASERLADFVALRASQGQTA